MSIAERFLGRRRPTVDLPQSAVCFLLKDDRRLAVLDTVRDGDAYGIGDLTDRLVERETAGDQYDHDDRKRVYVSLYQTHIPRLIEDGVLDYNDQETAVQLTDRGAQLVAVMDDLAERTAGVA